MQSWLILLHLIIPFLIDLQISVINCLFQLNNCMIIQSERYVLIKSNLFIVQTDYTVKKDQNRAFMISRAAMHFCLTNTKKAIKQDVLPNRNSILTYQNITIASDKLGLISVFKMLSICAFTVAFRKTKLLIISIHYFRDLYCALVSKHFIKHFGHFLWRNVTYVFNDFYFFVLCTFWQGKVIIICTFNVAMSLS